MKFIGFIGLGIMGKPMALNLLKGGVNLLVNDLNQKAVDELVSAGAKFGSLNDIGKACDIIFISLPSGDIVQSVLFNEEGIYSFISKGALICDLSSTKPEEAIYCADKLSEIGVGFLDAPVSGGEQKAIDGTLTFMVGGNQINFDKALPYFKIMGESYTLIGKNSLGCIAKFANQIIVNLTNVAIAEAFTLAVKAGADPVKVFEAIRSGSAGSKMLESKFPRIINHDFQYGGKVSIHLKDIKNVMDTANHVGAPLQFTSQVLELLQVLKNDGHNDEDHSCIIEFYEALANIKVTP